jgi:hypothetical protein
MTEDLAKWNLVLVETVFVSYYIAFSTVFPLHIDSQKQWC